MPGQSSFSRYGLSLEELALAFSLINRADAGRNLLASIYPEATEAEASARLSAASHSLLARNLCTINERGHPILDSALEKTLLPLFKFDCFYQISVVIGETQTNAVVHVRLRDSFTARTVQAGVVHVLDTGPSRSLAEYFDEIFADVRGKTNMEVQAPLTPGLLGQALERRNDLNECQNMLVGAGWTRELAQQLAEDLHNQVLRATLLRINASDETFEEQTKSSHHRVLMLLKGKMRGWGFMFDNTSDDASGRARQVNREGLKRLFQDFTGK